MTPDALPPPNEVSVRIEDVQAARRRIAPLVRATPLRRSHALSERAGLPVWLKMETMHDTGAFKLRGAANKMLSLTDAERRAGVITVSSGNHGRAVAYVARHLDVRAVVCVTTLVPAEKVDALRAVGAEVVVHGANQGDAHAKAQELSGRAGLTFIPPFDDPHVIAGQGTIGLEMLEACPDLDTVLVQLSGGGLVSGVALALKAIKPRVRVVAVSSLHGAAMLESIRAGRIVPVDESPSIADALPGPIPADNRYTFGMCRTLVDDFVQVSDQEIERAMAFILRHERCVVEGAAAAGVAGILAGAVPGDSAAAAAILTGDNIATDRALAIYRRAEA